MDDSLSVQFFWAIQFEDGNFLGRYSERCDAKDAVRFVSETDAQAIIDTFHIVSKAVQCMGVCSSVAILDNPEQREIGYVIGVLTEREETNRLKRILNRIDAIIPERNLLIGYTDNAMRGYLHRILDYLQEVKQ